MLWNHGLGGGAHAWNRVGCVSVRVGGGPSVECVWRGGSQSLLGPNPDCGIRGGGQRGPRPGQLPEDVHEDLVLPLGGLEAVVHPAVPERRPWEGGGGGQTVKTVDSVMG